MCFIFIIFTQAMSRLSCIYFVTGLPQKFSVYLIILLERPVNILYGIIITRLLSGLSEEIPISRQLKLRTNSN